MKSLRMIVTSVIVFAIVGSAFAFNAKRAGSFCVSTDGNTTCDAIQNNKEIVTTGGTALKYFSTWSGSQSTCVGTSNCTTDVRLNGN